LNVLFSDNEKNHYVFSTSSIIYKNIIEISREKIYCPHTLVIIWNNNLINNINRFVLQELRKACGAGFLIMINYIYNHMVYFTRMREFAWSVSDCEE